MDKDGQKAKNRDSDRAKGWKRDRQTDGQKAEDRESDRARGLERQADRWTEG